MKVKELIKLLQQADENADVYIWEDYYEESILAGVSYRKSENDVILTS